MALAVYVGSRKSPSDRAPRWGCRTPRQRTNRLPRRGKPELPLRLRGEGQKTARLLRRQGARVRVVPDTLMCESLAAAHLALVGADAVTPRLVVNKVGTRMLALAARDARRPCYVVADRSKWVPTSRPVPVYRPSQPFEATPRRLFGVIVGEDG